MRSSGCSPSSCTAAGWCRWPCNPAANPPVPSLRVKLNEDGSLAAEPVVMNRSSDSLFGVAAESATRATRRCAPLKIPAQFVPYYNDWKDLVVNFNLRDMG
jgi:colicin import membrane protein